MQTMFRRTLAALAVAALSTAAQAQDTPNQGQDQGQGPQPPVIQDSSRPEVTFNLGVASDYVFRGVSQTDENPQVFAGADLASGAFYAGAWGSNVEFAGDEDTNLEIDLYGGWRPEVAGYGLDFGAIYYLYPGQPDGAEYDFLELKAGASRAIGPVSGGLYAYWSPEFFAETGNALYLGANAAYELTPRALVTGALGRQDIDAGGDYTTWNLGLAFSLTDTLTLDGRYWDTDAEAFGDIYDGRLVVGLKAVF